MNQPCVTEECSYTFFGLVAWPVLLPQSPRPHRPGFVLRRVGMPQKLRESCHICAFSGALGNVKMMIFSAVPGRTRVFPLIRSHKGDLPLLRQSQAFQLCAGMGAGSVSCSRGKGAAG